MGDFEVISLYYHLSGFAKSAGKKKPRSMAGLMSGFVDPVYRCQLFTSRGQKFFAEKSPFIVRLVCRVFTDSKISSGWNVGDFIPGRTSRPACSFTPV